MLPTGAWSVDEARDALAGEVVDRQCHFAGAAEAERDYRAVVEGIGVGDAEGKLDRSRLLVGDSCRRHAGE